LNTNLHNKVLEEMNIIGNWKSSLDFIYNTNLLPKVKYDRYIEYIISTNGVNSILIPRDEDVNDNTYDLYGICYKYNFDYDRALDCFGKMKNTNLNMVIEVRSNIKYKIIDPLYLFNTEELLTSKQKDKSKVH